MGHEKQMNMLRVIVALMGLILCSESKAQISSEEIKEVRKYKNQVDLGLSNFRAFYSNTAAGTLIYKRRYRTGKLIEAQGVRLVRLMASANTQINFEDDPTRKAFDTTQIAFHPSDVIDFGLGVGIERQIGNKSLVHYHGLDIFGEYYSADDDFANGTLGGVIVNSTGTTDRLLETIKTGVNPFVGVKYYFTDQFSIGIEAGIRLYYFRTKMTEVGIEQVFVGGVITQEFVEKEPVISNGVIVRFNGIRFVTLGYAF